VPAIAAHAYSFATVGFFGGIVLIALINVLVHRMDKNHTHQLDLREHRHGEPTRHSSSEDEEHYEVALAPLRRALALEDSLNARRAHAGAPQPHSGLGSGASGATSNVVIAGGNGGGNGGGARGKGRGARRRARRAYNGAKRGALNAAASSSTSRRRHGNGDAQKDKAAVATATAAGAVEEGRLTTSAQSADSSSLSAEQEVAELRKKQLKTKGLLIALSVSLHNLPVRAAAAPRSPLSNQ
jgi:hypothetical protein